MQREDEASEAGGLDEADGADEAGARRVDTRIVETPIDARRLVADVERSKAGAVLTFAGVVRDHNRGRQVIAIDYHGYRPMAAREIVKIEAEADSRWPQTRTRIIHRLGHLEVGEASVLIAVSTEHRDEGFQALRFAIDTLKERVPIWKKEIYTDGDAWIEGS